MCCDQSVFLLIFAIQKHASVRISLEVDELTLNKQKLGCYSCPDCHRILRVEEICVAFDVH